MGYMEDKINYEKRAKIVALYSQLKNTAAVGRELGCSRQRVHQVLVAENIYTARPIYKRCRGCDRAFGVGEGEVKQAGYGLCFSCFQFLKKKPSRKAHYYRKTMYPTACVSCDKQFEKGELRSRGMCRVCYRNQPDIKEKMKEVRKAWRIKSGEVGRQKERAAYRKYYYLNRDKLLEKARLKRKYGNQIVVT